jgi:hypothetical protein
MSLVTPKYIYESPDKGKTIYRREFNNYNKRKLIDYNNQKKRNQHEHDEFVRLFRTRCGP